MTSIQALLQTVWLAMIVLVSGCERPPPEQSPEQMLLKEVRASGPRAALRLLDKLAAGDPAVRRDGHMYAHGIGIAALRSPDEVSEVFANCTPAYQSGCYHGVIQSYFLATQRSGGALTTARLDAICADYRADPNRYTLRFQCIHGLGHGLTMFHRHHLPTALKSCDLLSDRWEREHCYAGAFMENIVNATEPHHNADDPAGQAGHHNAHAPSPAGLAKSAHGHHSPLAAAPFPPLDPADLHYPCSKMAEKYLDACYTMQTSAMLFQSEHNVARAALECGRAPAKYRKTCFVSLGRDVSGIAQGSPAEASRLCSAATDSHSAECDAGVVQSVINMNADPAEGLAYCRALPTAPRKAACYRAVGLQAITLPQAKERLAQVCRLVERPYRPVCLDQRIGA